MSNTPHTLHAEFPADAEKMTALKVSNAHFAKMLVDYDAVNDKIHRSETRIDLLSEAEEADLRKKRSHIKDEIARTLRETA